MKHIDFEIIYAKNNDVSQDGFVKIPDCEDEDVEWFYYDDNCNVIPRQFTHHYGIGLTQIGATEEQSYEVDEFLKETNFEFVEFVEDIICNAKETDNKTYRKGNLIVKINEGAKFEVNVFDYSEEENWDSDFYLGFRCFYNQELIKLDDEVYFEDPYTYDETQVGDILTLSHNMYVVEVPKDFFDEDWDSDYRKEVIEEYKEAFETAYKKSLVKEWGVFGIAYDFISEQFKEESVEKFNDSCEKSEFADAVEDEFIDYSLDELYILTVDDIKRIIKEDYEYNQSLMEDCARDHEWEMKEREEELKKEFGF